MSVKVFAALNTLWETRVLQNEKNIFAEKCYGGVDQIDPIKH